MNKREVERRRLRSEDMYRTQEIPFETMQALVFGTAPGHDIEDAVVRYVSLAIDSMIEGGM